MTRQQIAEKHPDTFAWLAKGKAEGHLAVLLAALESEVLGTVIPLPGLPAAAVFATEHLCHAQHGADIRSASVRNFFADPLAERVPPRVKMPEATYASDKPTGPTEGSTRDAGSV